MTLSPTVPGVLLFVICFASSAAASHPGNHDDPAYTSVANNERIKNLVSPSPRSSITRHGFPSTWTMATRNLIHSARITDISHNTENSYLLAQVESKMISRFKNGKRGEGKSFICRLLGKVTKLDRDSQNWNHLQRAVAFDPSNMSQKRDPDFLRNVFHGRNRSSLFVRDQSNDTASSRQEWQDNATRRRGPRIARYDWDRWWTEPPSPTPHPSAGTFDLLLFTGIFAGVIVAMICCTLCCYCCDKDASETRSPGFTGRPAPLAGAPSRSPRSRPSAFAARMRAALGSGPPVQLSDSVRIASSQGSGIVRYSDLDSEDSRRFVEFLNPLTVADPDPGRSSSSSARRPVSGDVSRGGDRPPDYAQVATADLTSRSGRSTSTYDVVIRRPEEPPSYEVAYVGAGGAPTPPGDASATSHAS